MSTNILRFHNYYQCEWNLHKVLAKIFDYGVPRDCMHRKIFDYGVSRDCMHRKIFDYGVSRDCMHRKIYDLYTKEVVLIAEWR